MEKFTQTVYTRREYKAIIYKLQRVGTPHSIQIVNKGGRIVAWKITW